MFAKLIKIIKQTKSEMKRKYLYLISTITILIGCTGDKHLIEYEPIGIFSSEYTLETGAPRQGVLKPESKGIIILDSIYTESLAWLNEFEYIWVISHFHESKGWESIVNPPESEHKFGLFATRSPRRPNPIGLSLIKMDTIIKNKIYVRGIDLFDKTPILDIKPFLPSVDYVISEKNMIAEIYLGHHDEDFLTDSLVKEFVLGEEDNEPDSIK
ncbi:MAG: tRNA (N6-threonylcarbamoyladenosine(37)-N6)-methyltransferase TrmO [Bacteroidota bacterium]|nr:tRNA (N6-threonylcarbamoyladenosine(37)-N6)-methyltransferase TrmO [Bacteroidota bacterium]